MTTKLITTHLRTHAAQQLVESFSEAANTIYYMFAAKSTPFDNDSEPPSVNTSVTELHYNLWNQMTFGKHITPSNVRMAVSNNLWVSGTVYSMYDDQDVSLATSAFFVVSEESGNYAVFKCLDNNGGAASIDQPLYSETSADDDFYQTSDGYVWKLMFQVTGSDYTTFATDDYLPITIDANVAANAVSGALETYVITSGGLNYNSYANGTIAQAAVAGNTMLHAIESDTVTLSANTDFYKGSSLYIRSGTGAGQIKNISEYIVTGSAKRVLLDSAFTTLPDTSSVFEIAPRVKIEGDGSNAAAVATVNTSANSISSIEVVNRGTGYSYANVSFVGNTGVLDANGDLTSVNTAIARAIIGPPGGHGYSPNTELYSTTVIMSTTFANTESGSIPTENDFRKFGVLKDPRWANTVITVDDSAGFVDGQTITQATSGAVGTVTAVDSDGADTIRMNDVQGFFVTGYDVVASNTSNSSIAVSNTTMVDRSYTTFDQRETYTVDILDPGANGFVEDELVTQSTSGAAGYIHATSNTSNYLTNVRGTFSVSDDPSGTVEKMTGDTSAAIAKITGRVQGDLTEAFGEFLYVEHTPPISRANNQSEIIKLAIEF